MTGKSYLSKDPKETIILARFLAEEILKTKLGKSAILVALKGELGAGKTTFIKSFIKAMGVKTKIVSPTFIIWRRFKLLPKARFNSVFHFDAYRIKNAREISKLGLKEALAEPRNIVVVEWADRAARVFPKGAIWIKFKHGKKPNERHITFNRR